MTTSLYGPTGSSGTVSSSNLTTLYSGGTGTVPGNNLVVPGVLVVNGCSILTNCTSFNLLPTTATTINFGNEATTLSIGATTGVTTINNQLATANYSFPVADGTAGQVLVTDGAGTLSFSAVTSVGKTYDITASSTTGGANFNLNSDVPTTDTIKFSNGTGVTVSQINASEIGIAIGQDVATTASPTFNNLNLNGTLTVNADQTAGAGTINVYSGSTLGTIVYNSGTWDINDLTRITNSSAVTNNGFAILALEAQCSGTPAVGFGGNITYTIETPSSGVLDSAYVATRLTDVTAGAESTQYRISLMNAGAAPDVKFTIDSTADQLITGSQTSSTPVGIGGRVATNDYWHIGGYSVGGVGNDGALEIATANNSSTPGSAEPIFVRQYGGGTNSGNAWPWGNTITRTLTLLDNNGNTVLPVSLQLNGSTSGYSQFSAPATGSNLTYVLPGAAGAANTVLTNDGSGNLSWALPGGGGSTFGNVTIGVVTDNTISTTTGDLDITSATGVINLDTYTTLTDNRLTTSSVSTVTLDSFALATYFINVKDNVTGDIQSTRVDIMHNGTTAYINQYANMYTTADLSTFAATISGANVLLEITPASTNSTQFTFSRTAIRV